MLGFPPRLGVVKRELAGAEKEHARTFTIDHGNADHLNTVYSTSTSSGNNIPRKFVRHKTFRLHLCVPGVLVRLRESGRCGNSGLVSSAPLVKACRGSGGMIAFRLTARQYS
jgi:hypothetical protein